MAMAMAITTVSAPAAGLYPSSHFNTRFPSPHSSAKLSFQFPNRKLSGKAHHRVSSSFKAFWKKPNGFELGSLALPTTSSAHVTVCLAASGGGDNTEIADNNEGEGGGGDDKAKAVESLNLVSEADLLKKKARKARDRRKKLMRKRKLRKKGRWPPSKMAKLKNV